MEGRRIEMSATQVIASMLAAVTGAVAASDLGIAGTVIGAAVMSVASTAGAAVYKHYIGRSGQRLRAAAEVARIAPLVGGSGAWLGREHTTQAGQHPPPGSGDRGSPGEREARETDAEQTQLLPTIGFPRRSWHEADRANGFDERVRWRDDEATRTIGTRHGGGAGGPATVTLGAIHHGGPGENGATESMGARYGHPCGAPGDGEGDGHGGPDQPDGLHGPGGQGQRHRRPLLLAGIAAGAFLLAMGGITIVEAASGKPLDALLWGKHGSGTTVQNIVTGHSGRPAAHRTHPVPSPSSPAPSAVPTPTPGATAHASPSPTPSPTTPGPTPSPTASAGQRSPSAPSTPVLPSPGAG
jgi:hypothetical protein